MPIEDPNHVRTPLPLLITAAACVVAVSVASLIGWQLLTFCVNDTTSRENPYCSPSPLPAHLLAPLIATMALPVAVMIVLAAISVWSRRYLPLMVGVLPLALAAVVLPSLLPSIVQ